MLLNVIAEEEVPATALLDHFVKAWFINRELVAVPCCDACDRNVDDTNFNSRAFQRNDSHGWAANISSTKAAYLHHFA
uniref:Gpm540b n=1 Tax=Arundo donax TaxID=35708 RepID=A0A0A9CYG2_ARUDO